MKFIDLEQGSSQWLEWRKNIITATDAAVIMGVSPYVTPYQLRQRKLGLISEQPSNKAMQRGTELEPEARAKFIFDNKLHMVPACVQSSLHDFLGASLDGISADTSTLLEIKCNGKSRHEDVLKGIIPDLHMIQMQHQLLVTAAFTCIYYSFDGKNAHQIEVFPDENFSKEYLPKAQSFWECLKNNIPPDLTDRDYCDMQDNREWDAVATLYKGLNESIRHLEGRREEARKKLIEICDDQPSRGSGIKLIKSNMIGRIDYDKIPELKSIDLNAYRKPASISWRVFSE